MLFILIKDMKNNVFISGLKLKIMLSFSITNIPLQSAMIQGFLTLMHIQKMLV
jgi:hypothetical protein